MPIFLTASSFVSGSMTRPPVKTISYSGDDCAQLYRDTNKRMHTNIPAVMYALLFLTYTLICWKIVAWKIIFLSNCSKNWTGFLITHQKMLCSVLTVQKLQKSGLPIAFTPEHKKSKRIANLMSGTVTFAIGKGSRVGQFTKDN